MNTSKKVDVKVTDTTIEIFYNHNRIASHRLQRKRSGQYTVVNAIPTSKSVEQQTYRSCMGLLNLAEKYSDALMSNTIDQCVRSMD